MASPIGAAFTALGQGLPAIGQQIADMPNEAAKRAIIAAQLARMGQESTGAAFEQQQAQNSAQRTAEAREAINKALSSIAPTGAAIPADNQAVTPQNQENLPDRTAGIAAAANLNQPPKTVATPYGATNPDTAAALTASPVAGLASTNVPQTPVSRETTPEPVGLGKLTKTPPELLAVAMKYADTPIGKEILDRETQKEIAEERRDYMLGAIQNRTNTQENIADKRIEAQKELFNEKHPAGGAGGAVGPSKDEEKSYAETMKVLKNPNSRDLTYGRPLQNYLDAKELMNTLKTNPTYSAISRSMAKSSLPAQESIYANVMNGISKFAGTPSQPLPDAIKNQYLQDAQAIMADSKNRITGELDRVESTFPNKAKTPEWKNIRSKFIPAEAQAGNTVKSTSGHTYNF